MISYTFGLEVTVILEVVLILTMEYGLMVLLIWGVHFVVHMIIERCHYCSMTKAIAGTIAPLA